MLASTFLATSSLLLTTTLATSSPYSKFIADANSLLAAATGKDAAQLNALNSWQATQTAIPSANIDFEYQSYLDAFMTTTSAPLPAWVTAVPSSLQPIATSFLQAEASLVIKDIQPIVSQNQGAWSAYSAGRATQATGTLKNEKVLATASSGFKTTAASATKSSSGTASTTTATVPTTSVTSASGSPTKSPTGPATTSKSTSGADGPADMAAAAAVVGIMALVVLF